MTTRKGFTLTEIIVVIVLIVLLVAMAVPALSWMTGSNSVEAATNVMSAMVARSRMNAIGLAGHPNEFGIAVNKSGVATFYDSAQGRFAVMLVGGEELGVVDVAANTDFIYLPKGVGIQMLSGIDSERYLPQGAILFNKDGIFDTGMYTIPVGTLTSRGMTPVPLSSGIRSHIGFVLFDSEDLKDHVERGGNEEDWLDQFAVPYAVNRYNGTLIRGE